MFVRMMAGMLFGVLAAGCVESLPEGTVSLSMQTSSGAAAAHQDPLAWAKTASDDTIVAHFEELGGVAERDSRGRWIVSFLDSGFHRDDDLRILRHLPHVVSVGIEGGVTNAGIAHLEGVSTIEELSMLRTQASDEGLQVLRTLPRLKQLRLANPSDFGPPRISDKGLLHVSSLSRLELLSISSPGFTNRGLEHLVRLSSLRSLEAHGAFTDEGLRHLRALTNLDELKISGTGLTNDGIDHLLDLTTLKTLRLGGARLNNLGVLKLKSMPNLEDLDLSGPRGIDPTLSNIGELRWLKRLDLSWTSIDDAALPQFCGLADLEVLVLNFTNVTDDGAASLSCLDNLKSLSLRGTRVSEHGKERLLQLIPGLDMSPVR